MKKITSISAKIKVLGLVLIFLMLSIIVTTIYLNQQNVKDATTIDIAGKQRMLTQLIAKNIFYINYNSDKSFDELDLAVNEFTNALAILRHGDEQRGILSAPTAQISHKLVDINKLWKNYKYNISNFKAYINSKDNTHKQNIKNIISSVYKQNTKLLQQADKLVSMYTKYSESKTNFIKTFQYSAGYIIIMMFIYSMLQLRLIESNVDAFITYSKIIARDEDSQKIRPLKVEAETESEIVEMSDTMNCFIQKINSAVDYSNEALLQSKRASSKLEELTDEFDHILDELHDRSLSSKHLNNSEDIVIESTEELINSTKKLKELKAELNKLSQSCSLINK